MSSDAEIEAALAPRVRWLWWLSSRDPDRPRRLHAYEGALTRSVCGYADRVNVSAEGDLLNLERCPGARSCRRCEQLLGVKAPDRVMPPRGGKDASPAE